MVSGVTGVTLPRQCLPAAAMPTLDEALPVESFEGNAAHIVQHKSTPAPDSHSTLSHMLPFKSTPVSGA